MVSIFIIFIHYFQLDFDDVDDFDESDDDDDDDDEDDDEDGLFFIVVCFVVVFLLYRSLNVVIQMKIAWNNKGLVRIRLKKLKICRLKK